MELNSGASAVKQHSLQAFRMHRKKIERFQCYRMWGPEELQVLMGDFSHNWELCGFQERSASFYYWSIIFMALCGPTKN